MVKTAKASKKKPNNEAYLAKRREQKKLSMRRAREKLKNNPEKHEEIKLKRRQTYKKLKDEGKIKSIDEMSSREQRKVRKEWKIRSRNYRKRQKNLQNEQEYVELNTPPESPAVDLEEVPNASRQKHSGQKVARKNRDRKNREIKSLKEKLKKAERKALKYKQRLNRLQKKSKNDTPRKVVETLLKGHKNVSKEVRKRLLFGEVISKQLKENFQSPNDNRKCNKCVTGKVISKYRFVEYLRSLTSQRTVVRKGYFKTKRLNHRAESLRLKVRKFLERDDNSRMTAGKKETVTKKKGKKQKRYLNDSLKNLHIKFLRENPRYKCLSYSYFCKFRPFWVTIPTVTTRDTCLCKTHSNVGLLVTKLKKLNIISEKSPSELVTSLCCPGLLKEKCLQMQCTDCATKEIKFNDFNSTEKTSYEKWVTKIVPLSVKERIKMCKKTIKVSVPCDLSELVAEMKKSIKPFMEHVSNIMHQFNIVQDIKDNLSEYECLLHFDYSQNYSCKYANEIQSFHFGGSRTQITLHTAVLYYKDSTKPIKHKSFCTISEDLRHDPSAVCAHLDPVIDKMKSIIPNLQKVHFLSDGPSTQYRNKSMFYLFGKYLCDKLKVQEVLWHYSEAGHGKGAADGIGGSTKRLADSLVSRGSDVANFEEFKNALLENCKKTSVFSVFTEQIQAIDAFLPTHLETFAGTMKIHQLSWDKEKPFIIQARRLSCLKCSSNKSCLHFDLGEIKLRNEEDEASKKIGILFYLYFYIFAPYYLHLT